MSWIAVGVAAVGTVGAIISRSNANKEARRQLANRPRYQIDENIKKQLGLAQTQYGGRSGAAAAAERNIYQAAANAQSNINRAATDVNQALLGSGQIQGQTNQAFNQLEMQEIADEQRRYQNLINAQNAMAGEQKEAWQWNEKGRWQDETATKAAIAQNRANSWKDVTQMGMAGANLSASGAFNKGTSGRSDQQISESMNKNKVNEMPLYSAPTGNWYNTANNMGTMPNNTSSSFGGNQGLLGNNTTLFDLNNMGIYGGYRPR